MATIITTVQELQDISLDLTDDYELGNHIEAAGYDFTMLGTLTGSLDGMGFEIRDLTIVDNDTALYGGLFQVNQGTIKNVHLLDCDIDITVSVGNAVAAALVKSNDVAGVIENCSATGTVSVVAAGVAAAHGLVAFNDGSISTSWSSVITSASAPTAFATGFVRENIGPISNCFARGAATAIGATSYAVGFIEQNFAAGVISYCYSTGAPTAGAIAGFCRVNDDTITACFWDTQTSGTAVSDGGTGKTTAQMKQQATFIGWDFVTTWAIDAAENDGYPYFSCGGIVARALAAINIARTTATLFGRLVFDGGAACECRFRHREVGAAYSYTAFANGKVSGNTFEADLSSLTEDTAYEFAAQAKNPTMSEWSALKRFVTLSPREETSVEDKPTLELIRNVEMAAQGRFFIDEEGNAVYKSRYARNP